MATTKKIKTIGVLTGGGDCPGLNAVIRAVVKTAYGHYGMEVLGIRDGFEGLIHGKQHIMKLTPDAVRGILPRGGTILGTTNRGNPFAFVPAGSKAKPKNMSRAAIANFKELGLDALVVIGGDGSLGIGLDFFKLGLPVVGIPKTIDNDLSATDYTFGFNTAVNTATEAIDKLHTTAESHHRIMFLEVMGRNAGWIAMESGISGGADIILIPEIPYDIKTVCKRVEARSRHGRMFSIAVVAEGAKPLGGKEVYADETARRLGGISHSIARDVAKLTGHETRVTVLGHVQRGGSPSAFDRLLGTRFGAAAVKLVADRQFGRMVCLRGMNIESVTLEQATGVLKTVPPDGELVRAARDVGITLGDPDRD